MPKSSTPYQPISAKNFPNATPADTTHAGAKTDVKYGAPREALDAAMRQIKEDSKYQSDVQREMGGVHDTRLGEISQLLNQQLGQNTGRIQSLYGGAQDSINKGYGEAMLASQGASQSVLDNLRRSMDRLGLQAAEGDGTSDITQQLTDNRALNLTAGAGAVGNMANLGADMTAISTKGESDALQEWAGKRDEFAKRIQNAVMQINQDYNTKRNQLLQEISGLERTRGADFVATLTDTINERLERERADRMEKLNAEIQRGQLEVARGQLGVARGGLSLRQKELEHAMKEKESDLQSKDPLVRQRALHEYTMLQKEMNAQGAGAEGRRYSGIAGVGQWIGDQSGSPETGQKFQRHFERLLSQAAQSNSEGGLSDYQAFDREVRNSVPPHLQAKYNTAWNVYIGKYSSFEP